MSPLGLGRSAASSDQQQQQGTVLPVEVPTLPVELLTLICQGLPELTLKFVRLSSSQLAIATAPLINCITFRQWPGATVDLRRFHHAAHLHLDMQLSESSHAKSEFTETASSCFSKVICPEDAWIQLQQLVSQLPCLNSLHLPHWESSSSSSSIPRMPAAVTGYLTALTRLDLQDLTLLPAGLQLPHLKAASLLSNDITVDLAAVAAFAPNLQQLKCKRLELSATPPAAAAAAAAANDDQAAAAVAVHGGGHALPAVDAAIAAGAQPLGPGQLAGAPTGNAVASPAVLRRCTHFGAQTVIVLGAASPAAAAAAFGKAFPSLSVLFRVPQVSGLLVSVPGQDDNSSKDAGYDEMLQWLPGLKAIRGRNWFSSRSWFLIRGSDAMATEHWRSLRCISFHSHSYPDGSSDFLDISKAPQLERLRLTFNYPYTKADDLVRELQKLPCLSHLALPAALLCGRCCPEKYYPGLRQRLEGLVASTNLRKLQLLTLPAATVGLATFYCSHQESVREGMVALHSKARAMQSKQRSAAVGARAGVQAPAALGQQVAPKKQQLGHLHQPPQRVPELELELVTENPQWSDESYTGGRDAGHPVWGVYVSRHEC